MKGSMPLKMTLTTCKYTLSTERTEKSFGEMLVQVAFLIRGLFICAFAICYNIPKFSIRGIFPRLFAIFDEIRLKIGLIEVFFGRTVLPHNLRFQYSRYFSKTYQPRITRAACTTIRGHLGDKF
jgi:hypothetical protein